MPDGFLVLYYNFRNTFEYPFSSHLITLFGPGDSERRKKHGIGLVLQTVHE